MPSIRRNWRSKRQKNPNRRLDKEMDLLARLPTPALEKFIIRLRNNAPIAHLFIIFVAATIAFLLSRFWTIVSEETFPEYTKTLLHVAFPALILVIPVAGFKLFANRKAQRITFKTLAISFGLGFAALVVLQMWSDDAPLVDLYSSVLGLFLVLTALVYYIGSMRKASNISDNEANRLWDIFMNGEQSQLENLELKLQNIENTQQELLASLSQVHFLIEKQGRSLCSPDIATANDEDTDALSYFVRFKQTISDCLHRALRELR